MLLRWWRFVTLALTALSMGLSFAHVMELPVKLRYPPGLYADVNSTLYYLFGKVGAVLVVASVVGAAGLAVLVRRRHPAFAWTLSGAILLGVGLAAWWVIVFPVNAEAARTAPEHLAAMWARLRNRWEYGHLTYFILQFLGFCALLLPVILETPERRSPQ